MKPKFMLYLAVMLFVLPGFALAGSVTQKDFLADNTEQLLNLCTATPDDPLFNHAMNFCHGYLVGAYDYYEAAHHHKEGARLVCFPDPPPSRNEVVNMFVEWAKAHPQYRQNKAANTEFRFLSEKFPCNP